jgi:MoxR-like ATPase
MHPDIAVGASPSASIALFRAAQAFAAVKGWEYVLPDFVKLLAPSILEHRVILKPEARLQRKAVTEIIWRMLEETPVPSLKEQ